MIIYVYYDGEALVQLFDILAFDYVDYFHDGESGDIFLDE